MPSLVSCTASMVNSGLWSSIQSRLHLWKMASLMRRNTSRCTALSTIGGNKELWMTCLCLSHSHPLQHELDSRVHLESLRRNEKIAGETFATGQTVSPFSPLTNASFKKAHLPLHCPFGTNANRVTHRQSYPLTLVGSLSWWLDFLPKQISWHLAISLTPLNWSTPTKNS